MFMRILRLSRVLLFCNKIVINALHLSRDLSLVG